MSVFQGHVGLNLSSAKLDLVEVNYKDKNYFLENVDEEYFSEFISFSEKETKIITILQQALDNILIRKSFNSSNVSFSLPSNLFKVFEVPFDNTLHKNDLANHLSWEFSVLFPSLKREDYVIRHYQLEMNIRKKNLLILFALERRIINILNKFSARNNLTMKFVDDEHIASSIATNLSEITNGNILSVFIGLHYFTVLVMNNNQPVYFKKTSVKSYANFEPVFVEEYRRLIDTINEEMKFEKVFLFGYKYPTSIIEVLEKELGSEISYSNPFSVIKSSDKLKEFQLTKNNPAAFASAAGMAYRLF
ncbi:MAG: hypothetical protein CO129_01660 [Ignavibacteriales bacterium CG_4_9_14_3_um_filter_34_10]|nr:MAG: hypothetical protein CO129_01660 [Ignavibacteriales bacterium CG_4_9_14_3_um_filter_34_10]